MERCFSFLLEKDKLSHKYIRPYQIVEQLKPETYELELSVELAKIHNVFYVSMLISYVHDLSHVLQVQLIGLKEDMSYE